MNVEERKIYMREYLREYAKTPDQRKRRRSYQKQSYADGKRYSRKYVERYPNRYLHKTAKRRAKIRNMEFTLTYDDIQIPEYCPILGLKLGIGYGSGGKWNSPSIDRIDNSKGYTKENIQVISHLANSMKSVANKEQLLKFANWIIKYYE